MIKKYAVDILSVIIGFTLLLFPKVSDGVFVFDVGQGDAILIQQEDTQVLVDGGADDTILYRLGEHMPFGDMQIELMVLTHPHADHINGLMYVMERYDVKKVWLNEVSYESSIYEQFLNFDVEMVDVKEGSKYILQDWNIEVLFSSDDIYSKDSNINNASIVLQVNTNISKILLMGDAEVEVEKKLIREGKLEDINILKAGHHCSKTASSQPFLDLTRPEIAICSYGEGNKFGHPHKETIDNFQKRNILILSTSKEGNIHLL